MDKKDMKIIKGAGKSNIYLIWDDKISLLQIKDDVIIVDTKWVHQLKKLAIHHRQKSNGKWDAIATLLCSDGHRHNIQIGKIICDLESGKVAELKKGMIYPYDGEECHHKLNRIDNRAEALESLTKEEHKKRHMRAYGGNKKSHANIKININIESIQIEIGDQL